MMMSTATMLPTTDVTVVDGIRKLATICRPRCGPNRGVAGTVSRPLAVPSHTFIVKRYLEAGGWSAANAAAVACLVLDT